MSLFNPIISLSITVTGGSGQATLSFTNTVTRTIFDTIAAAEHSWIVTDSNDKPIAGREVRPTIKMITEEYPVQNGFKFKIFDADTDGTYEVRLCLRGRSV